MHVGRKMLIRKPCCRAPESRLAHIRLVRDGIEFDDWSRERGKPTDSSCLPVRCLSANECKPVVSLFLHPAGLLVGLSSAGQFVKHRDHR